MTRVGRDLKALVPPPAVGRVTFRSKLYQTWPCTLPGMGHHSFSGQCLPGEGGYMRGEDTLLCVIHCWGWGENPPVGMEGESGIVNTACAGHWGQSRALSPPLPCLRKVWLLLEEKWGREKQWLIHPLLGTLIPAGWKALLEPPWFLLLPFAARGVRSVPCAVPSRGDALASQHTELWRNSRERTPEELDHPAGPGCGKWDVHSGHCG